jgi:hypothetical protein
MCRRLAPLLLVASAQALAPPPQLRLLTCDLDDTFWPTAEVVAAANAALYKALEARDADASLLGETMKRLRRAAGVQMSYTEARTSAIAELLGGEPGAEELFELWLDARQRASEDLLFPDAATSLAEVRRRHPDAMIGAVTNGRVWRAHGLARRRGAVVAGECLLDDVGRGPREAAARRGGRRRGGRRGPHDWGACGAA